MDEATREQLAMMPMGPDMAEAAGLLLDNLGITPVEGGVIDIVVEGTHGSKRNEQMVTDSFDFGTRLRQKGEASKVENNPVSIAVEDVSEATPVQVHVIAEEVTEEPDSYKLIGEDLPALFNELEVLDRLPDVNQDPRAARGYDDVVGASMQDIVKGMRNGTISSDSVALRMARNVGAAINKDLMGSIINELGKSLGIEDKRLFSQMVSGAIGRTGSVESILLEDSIDTMVTAAQKQGLPKTAQLMLAVAYGASYKHKNKARAQRLREYASERLIASSKG